MTAKQKTDIPEFTIEDLQRMTPEQLAELDDLLFQEPWMPLPGPQMMAWESKAQIIGYGGAAGGGKTDLACGMATCKHIKTLVLRRESTQLVGIMDRMENIIGNRDGLSTGRGIVWRPTVNGKRRFIQMGGLSNPDDHKKYQGQDHDLKVIDEATECRESDVRFVMGWMRSADPTIQSQVLMTFNPPTTSEGRWVVRYFAPWLDPKHPKPAKPGELRWFTTHPTQGHDVECDGPDTVIIEGEECKPMSRTFIPAKIEDNVYYMETGYKATLQALPEPLRSQMLKGDFMAGVEDDKWQVIPTKWIEAAMERWRPKEEYFAKGEPIVMTSMGVDVACGGVDKTIISPRYGTWFDKLITYPGSVTSDGPITASLVIAQRRDRAPVHIDHAGIGQSAFDFLRTNNVQVVGVNNAEKSFGMSNQGDLRFINRRAEIYWRLREALDPANEIQIALPPDPELLADLTIVRWELTPQGIKIRSKDEIKKDLGRSPDRGDAVTLAMIETLKEDMDPLIAQRQYKVRTDYDPYSEERMSPSQYEDVNYNSTKDYNPYD